MAVVRPGPVRRCPVAASEMSRKKRPAPEYSSTAP